MAYLALVPQHELTRAALRARPDTPDNRHKDVMALFGELPGLPRRDARILFRLERFSNRVPAYLIRSGVPLAHPTPGTRMRNETDLTPQSGSFVKYRIAINAVQRLRDGGVRPVPGDSHKGERPTLTFWLQEKLSAGLTELSILNHDREIVGTNRNSTQTRKNLKTIQVDTIDGVARVRDPSALGFFLTEGVGRARAYGCGLLTIRPFG